VSRSLRAESSSTFGGRREEVKEGIFDLVETIHCDELLEFQGFNEMLIDFAVLPE